MNGRGGPRQSGRLDVFLVAGETSSDLLGAGLMQALTEIEEGGVSFRGVGGPHMSEAGLTSLFPIGDLTSIGIGAVLVKLPTILRRLRETVAAIEASPPDVLILIDAPDFTHRIAARVRRRLPPLPIVKYVSPTVWIWRPGRAPAMRRAIDLILALLPFEPEVHRQLGGPPCIYVGHPLVGRLDELRPSPHEAEARASDPPLVLALPGSRPQEIARLTAIFGEVLGMMSSRGIRPNVVLPTLAHLVEDITHATRSWPVLPHIVTSESDKYAAIRRARAALAASGTVTLELALAGVPHVAAYRIPAVEALILRAMARVHPVIGVRSVILANLVLGEQAVPEFLQRRCTAADIAPALEKIIRDSPARRRQIEAFRRLDGVLGIGGDSPSMRAARAVLDLLGRG
jgi:lipid-A-disaccharide synthase